MVTRILELLLRILEARLPYFAERLPYFRRVLLYLLGRLRAKVAFRGVLEGSPPWLRRMRLRLAISRLLGRFRRLAYWLPVLWRDRDFDHGYLYLLVAAKARRMADFFEREGIAEDALETAADLRYLAALAERIGQGPKFVLDGEYESFALSRWARSRHDPALEELSRLLRRKSLRWWD